VRGLEPNRSAEGRSSSGPLVRGPELKAGQKVDDRKDPGEVEKEIDRIGARGGEDREEPIPAYEQRLVEVIDRCVATYPGLEDEIALRYKAAFVFYDHRHDVEAARRFGELIARWPADPFSRKAADLTLHLLEARRQWLELNRRARELLSNAPLIDQDRDFGARVLDLVAASQYQYADQTLYQERKDPAQAATKLRELAAEFPRSRHAPQALLYAMLLHAEAGQLDLGIEEGQRLLKDYPDAKAIDGKDLVGRALQALSSCYERTADFQSAADLNERFADRVLAARAGRSQPGALEELGEDAAKAADALYDAARWNEGLGRLDRAAALYRRYLAAFPARQARKDIRAAELYLNLGVLAVKAKDFQEAARLFKSYVERYGAQVGPGAVVLAKAQEMGALSQLGKEAEALAKAAQVVRSYQALSAQEKTSEGALEALAHARFLWLEPQWRAYLALRFDDLARFGRDYPAKVRAIGDSEKGTGLLGAYAAVVRIGAADWALAAAARIGMAYEDFAQRLLESPDPKGLDDEQLALYRGELERGAFPLEEKAAAAFESVVAASAQKQIYNEWTLEAQAALNRYRPGTFPEVRLVPLEGAEPFLTAGPMMGEPAVAKGTEPGRGGP
jgi:outer membrane protein assembly factor BamD (BamD/ComL family)